MSVDTGARAAHRTDNGDQAAILRIDGLSRSFGGVAAVQDASFAAPPGQITGLIGPNGAGKSTLVDLISGMTRPDRGHVFYDGTDIAGWPADRVAQRGLIRTFQLSSEFARLTVLENLLQAARGHRGDSVMGALLGPRYWGKTERELVGRAREFLARFGLSNLESEYAGDLSGGQKRMVEIMRALMSEPKLLLLDEPFAGVSPSLSLEVQKHLLSLRAGGLSMLLIEHDLESVERLCDSVVVLANGSVLASGTMTVLRENQEVIDAYLG